MNNKDDGEPKSGMASLRNNILWSVVAVVMSVFAGMLGSIFCVLFLDGNIRPDDLADICFWGGKIGLICGIVVICIAFPLSVKNKIIVTLSAQPFIIVISGVCLFFELISYLRH